ncbi:MAG: MFS transporter [Pseudomonadota bacterium]
MNADAQSPFSVPAYRRLFTAHSTALIGSGISTIALALLAINIAPTQASAVLGVALAIKMVAYVAIAPFAGQVSTRIRPKTLLVTLDLIRAGVVLSMPFIEAVWQIYLAIALLSAAAALFTPTYQALLPGVVTHEGAYLRALSWAQVAGSVEQIASPALAALLLLALTFNDLFILNALTFIFSAVLIGLTALAHAGTTGAQAPPWWGISAYLRTPRLRAVAIAYVGVAGASAMVIVNTAVFVQQHLGASASIMSLTLMASGVGTALGAMAVPRLPYSPRTLLVGGNLLMASALAVGWMGVDWPILMAMWLCVGMGLGLVQTPVGSVIRSSCHERHRAAFFAANFALSHAGWLLAYLLAGYLGAAHNWPLTFALIASLPLGAALACAAIYPQPDETALDHSHDGVVHRHVFYIDETHTSWPR